MRDAVICEPIRTPVGGYGGSLKDVPAGELAATVVRALVERTGVKAGDIDDIVFGQVYPNSEAPAIGAHRRARRGARHRRPGLPARPALRFGAAGGNQRLDERADRGG